MKTRTLVKVALFLLIVVSVAVVVLQLIIGPLSRNAHSSRSFGGASIHVPIQPQSSAPADKVVANNKFVLALTYWEQLTMATNNLYHLVRVSSRWGARVVVPFTKDSRLYGLPREGVHPLDLVFDVKQLVRLMTTKQHLLPMENFDSFLETASRDLIFISLHYGRRTKHQSTACHGRANHLALSPLNKLASARNLSLFRIARCCSFAKKTVTTPAEISETCKLSRFKSYTLVIWNWRGFVCKLKQPRLVIPSLCREGKHLINGSTGSYPHSQYVLGNASLFVQKYFTPREKYIGIHVRGDSLIVRNRAVPGIVPVCFNQLASLLTDLSTAYPNIRSLLVGDGKVSSIFSGELRRHGLTHFHFEPKDFSAAQDSGFVAQVESCIAARAEVLIIVGGGSFAGQIISRYKHSMQSNSRLVYFICTDERKLHSVSFRNW